MATLDAASPDTAQNDETNAIDQKLLNTLKRYASDTKPRQPEIPFPRKFGDSGDFFRKANDLATKVIEDQTKSMNASLDTLLIFAGLFSSVNSTLFAISYPMLSPGPSDATNQLLQQLVTANQTLPVPPSFVMSPNARRDNVLFSASLLFSLFAAFGAVLGKQWLVSWSRIPPGVSQKKEASQLQDKITNADIWKLQFLLEMLLPSMLQISLVLFIVGLVDLLWATDPTTGHYNCGLAGLWYLAFFLTVPLAVIFPSCPFQTPISHAVVTTLVWAAAIVPHSWKYDARHRDPRKPDLEYDDPKAQLGLKRWMWAKTNDLVAYLQKSSGHADPPLDSLASQTTNFIKNHTDDPSLLGIAALNLSALHSMDMVEYLSEQILEPLYALGLEHVEIMRTKSQADVTYQETLLICTAVHRALVHFYLANDPRFRCGSNLDQHIFNLARSVKDIGHLEGTELGHSAGMIHNPKTFVSSCPAPLPSVYLAAMLVTFMHGVSPTGLHPDTPRILASAIGAHLRSPTHNTMTLLAWIIHVLRSQMPYGNERAMDTPDIQISPQSKDIEDATSTRTIWEAYTNTGRLKGPGDDHPLQLSLVLYSWSFDEVLGRPEYLWHNMLNAIGLPEIHAMDNTRKAERVAQTAAFFLRQVTNDLRSLENTEPGRSATSRLRGLKAQATILLRQALRKAIRNDFGTIEDFLGGLSNLVDKAALRDNMPKIFRHARLLQAIYSLLGVSEASLEQEAGLFRTKDSVVAPLVNELSGKDESPENSLIMGRVALWVISHRASSWFETRDVTVRELFIEAGMPHALTDFMKRIEEMRTSEFDRIWDADVLPLMRVLFKQEEWLNAFSSVLEGMVTREPVSDKMILTILLLSSELNTAEITFQSTSSTSHQGWFSPPLLTCLTSWAKEMLSDIGAKSLETIRLINLYVKTFEHLQTGRDEELLHLKAAIKELEQAELEYERRSKGLSQDPGVAQFAEATSRNSGHTRSRTSLRISYSDVGKGAIEEV